MIYTGGCNWIVKIMADGDNQEDSCKIRNRTSQSGCFTASLFNQTSVELENGQSPGVPRPNITKNIKGSSYSHLNSDGYPKPGTIIYKDMPILGILRKETNSKNKQDEEEYDDSVIYKKAIPQIVDSYCDSYNSKGIRVIKIRMCSVRDVKPGDKFASREGNKTIISASQYDEEEGVCDNGIIPDAVVSTHAFPTRMTINQFMEGIVADACSNLGCFADATIFSGSDEQKIKELMEQGGIKNFGYKRMFHGETGEEIWEPIFCVPMYYQRLTHMIDDKTTIVDKPSYDIRTGQSNKGAAVGGGGRFGEMEAIAMIANGLVSFLKEKFFNKGDGKEVYICDKCYKIANVNPDPEYDVYNCPRCEFTTMTKVNLCVATIKMLRYLAALGVDTKIVPERPIFKELA